MISFFSNKTLTFVKATISACIVSAPVICTAQPGLSLYDFDWSKAMAEHDMIWKKLPTDWKHSPFIGNGEQGSMIYQTDPNTIRWTVGCSAAHDHRPHAEDNFTDKNTTVLNRGRHFIGHLELQSKSEIKAGTARLHLWDAQTTGTLNTSAGQLTWKTITHAKEPVIYIELSGGAAIKNFTFSYIPALAQNPRAIRAKKPRTPANPPPEVKKLSDGIQTAVQNLHSGGQTAVAWKQVKTATTIQLWLSVQHSFPTQDAVTKSVTAVQKAIAADNKKWLSAHKNWWHNYYPQSYISTGDSYWDSFYWAQQYKLGCATREKGWIIDNQGPWLQPTAWNAIWWNLNAQLSHSPFTTANRRGSGSALSYKLGLHRDNLALNVAEPYRKDSYAIGRNTSGWDLLGHAGEPGAGRKGMDKSIGRETANLLWALHNVDMEYRYWQDKKLRDEVLYPLMVRAVNYYIHFLKEGDDGRLHLPTTHSPEFRNVADCSYDIDLLRWANNRLIELAEEKGLTAAQEPLLTKWKSIDQKLIATHTDPKTGFMLGKGQILNGGHRHWSHLLAIYPLRTITPIIEADRELILRSLNHWHGFKRGGMGYSVTGGSCMASLLGDGDRAYTFLNRLKGFLLPNTFYVELGKLPVIETPLHGATAMQEMLLQSWGGRLRIFPAAPTAWPDIQFHQLRGEGAFLISARRENNKTKWASIHAEVGGTVEVEPQISNAQWATSKGVTVKQLKPGIYQISSPADGKIIFWPKDQKRPALKVSPIPTKGQNHRFGRP